MWCCFIEKAENGYIVSYPNEEDENNIIPHVIEEDPKDALKEHEDLHYWLMDFFAHSGSKHDGERLRIIREKQNG